MAINETDGFKFLDGEMIVIETDRVSDYVDYIIEKQIKSIYLCNLYYRGTNIDFLKKIDFIENLCITSSSIKSFEVLQYLNHLQSLSVQETEAMINLEHNLSLCELGIKMNKYVVGIEKLKNLKKLRLYNYNPKSKSLSELSELNLLEELKIVHSSIDSFKGCGALANLTKLEVDYLRKMYYIDELEALNSTLKILEFNSCKKIVNHKYVSCLSNLEKLSFNECSDIESISFIKKMNNLKSFVFMNTNVIDGNIEHCRGIEYVAFTNKKHFSHKLIEFQNER